MSQKSKQPRPPVHYAIEHGADGAPKSLAWSSEIQARGEARDREWREKRDAMDRAARKPMECCVEWAKARGLWG